jgi:hypothetical protein
MKNELKAGQRFGLLTIEKYIGRIPNRAGYYYLCICDCGKHTVAPAQHLISGRYIACGCQRGKRKQKKDGITHNPSKPKIMQKKWIQKQCRFSESEVEIIINAAEKSGLSFAGFIQKAAIEKAMSTI